MSKFFFGIGGAVVGFWAGLWLMLAPFAQGYQPSGAAWADPTKASFWTGIGLVIVSVVGFILYALDLIEEMRRRGIIERKVKPQPQPQQEYAPQVVSQGNSAIEQAITPLLVEMLRDMQQQRQRREEQTPHAGEHTAQPASGERPQHDGPEAERRADS